MDLAMVATDWAYHIVAPVDLAGLPPEGAEVPTMLRGPGMFGNIVSVSARSGAAPYERRTDRLFADHVPERHGGDGVRGGPNPGPRGARRLLRGRGLPHRPGPAAGVRLLTLTREPTESGRERGPAGGPPPPKRSNASACDKQKHPVRSPAFLPSFLYPLRSAPLVLVNQSVPGYHVHRRGQAGPVALAARHGREAP